MQTNNEDFLDLDEGSPLDADEDAGGEAEQKPDEHIEALRRLEERLARAEQALVQRDTKQADERKSQDAAVLDAEEAALTLKRRTALNEDDMDAFDEADKQLRAIERKRVLMEQRVQQPDPADAQPVNPWEKFKATLAPEARSWVERNDWFDPGSPNYDSVRARKAEQLAVELEKRYGRNNRKMYDEIDGRLTRKREGADVAGVPRGGGSVLRERGPGSLVRPSRQESESMQRWGFDPAKAQDIRAWRGRNEQLQ